MDAAEFLPDFPGRLVPTERGAWAYVPSPAPEKLPLTLEIVTALAAAERSLGQLTGMLRAGGQLGPHLVARPLLRREAISSSRIEGTVTTPEKLVLFELDGTDQPGGLDEEGDTREVANYVLALEHGVRRLQELPICLRLIRELHEILMRGVRGEEDRPGELRTVQNFIGATHDIRDARFVPPPVHELDACLRAFEAYVQPRYEEETPALPDLIRIALAHYQFETIHPFRDGNGRVGRILIPLMLCATSKLDAPALYLSPYLERHRGRYVDLLLRASKTGDFASWIRFFLDAVAESARESIARTEALLDLRERYRAKLSAARGSSLQLKLVDALFETPTLSIAGAARLLELSQPAAKQHIDRLVAAGIVEEVSGRRRNQRFLAREILAVAHEASPAGADSSSRRR